MLATVASLVRVKYRSSEEMSLEIISKNNALTTKYVSPGFPRQQHLVTMALKHQKKITG